MLLKTLDVVMEPVGHEVELKFDVRYQPQSNSDKDEKWILNIQSQGMGTKMTKVGGTWIPLPVHKDHSFIAGDPSLQVPTNVTINGEGQHTFVSRVQKNDILVPDNDQYFFTCKLQPVGGPPESNNKLCTFKGDID